MRRSGQQPACHPFPPCSCHQACRLARNDEQQLAFTLHGGPVTASLDDMRDELELKAQKLPAHDVWQVAVRRAQEIFGIPASALLNAANVAQLVAALPRLGGFEIRFQLFLAQYHPDLARKRAERKVMQAEHAMF